MKQCPICQTSNDAEALFCAECGHRFTSNAPAPQPQPQTQAPAPNMAGQASAKPSKDFGKAKKATSRKSKKSLRSPLLGADDEDDSYGDPPSSAPRERSTKSKLRSPLLGEDDDSDYGYDSGSSSESHFPHPRRSKKKTGSSESTSGSLHSPLLGGDSQAYDEPESRPQRGNTKTRLRSPVLGSADDYQYYDDDEYDDQEDPNALRSPLLKAKSHTRENKRSDINAATTGTGQHTQVPQPPPQPVPPPQPAPPQPAPPPQQMQPPAAPPPAPPPPQPQPSKPPMQPAAPVSTGSRMNPPPVPGQPAAPPFPQAPNASTTGTNMNAPGHPNLGQVNPPAAFNPESKPQVEEAPPKIDPPKEKPEPAKDSTEEAGPKDRRKKPRRATVERRSFANMREESQPSQGTGEFQVQSGAGLNPVSLMAITVTAMIGLLFKLYYLFIFFSQYDLTNEQTMTLVIDQVTTLIVFLGLIIFSLTAKKS